MRTRYLLSYDVRDPVRLRRTIKIAETWGDRIQYSLFVCDLDESERLRLDAALRRVLDVDVDRALLIDLGPPGPPSARRFRWISRGVKLRESGEARIL